MATDFEAHEWDPDKALESLTAESSALDEGDEAKTAERLLRQALPGATAAVVNLALYSPNEKTRFEAAKVIMDRCLGTTAANDALTRSKDPLTELVEQIWATK